MRYIVRARSRKTDDPTFDKVVYMAECSVDGFYFVDEFDDATIFNERSDSKRIQNAMLQMENRKKDLITRCERIILDEKN